MKKNEFKIFHFIIFHMAPLDTISDLTPGFEIWAITTTVYTAVCLPLAIAMYYTMYKHRREYKIVTMRGQENVRYLFWTIVVISAYHMVVTMSLWAKTYLIIQWLAAQCRHWSLLASIIAHMAYQVVICYSANRMTGHNAPWWMPKSWWQFSDKPNKLLEKITVVCFAVFIPIWIFGCLMGVFTPPGSMKPLDSPIPIMMYELLMIGYYLTLLSVWGGYIWMNRGISRYYSHQWTSVCCLVPTTIILIVKIFVILVVLAGSLSIYTLYPEEQMIDSFTDLVCAHLMFFVYVADPVFSIWFGRKERIDRFENFTGHALKWDITDSMSRTSQVQA